MDVFKVLLFYPDCGQVYKCDAINYQDGIWLVPDWMTDQASGISKPKRIIRIDRLILCESTFPDCRFLLVPGQLSEGVLHGDIDPRPPVEVRDLPNIELRFDLDSSPCHSAEEPAAQLSTNNEQVGKSHSA